MVALHPSAHPCRGAIQFAVVLLIAGAVGVVGVVWKASHFHQFNTGPSPAKITTQVEAVDQQQAKIDVAQKTGQAAQTAQIKEGQKLNAATGQALDAASPSSKADPAIALAGRLNDKAGAALAAGVGPLTADEQAWVGQLIRDATSASETRRAAAEAALKTSDEKLRDAQTRLETAQHEADNAKQAKAELKRQLDSTLADKNIAAEFADTLIRWGIYAAIAWFVAAILLPLLEGPFPALKGISTVAHAFLAPLAAKGKAEAEALARDGVATAHHLIQLVAAKAPQIAAEAQQIKSEWLTEADGTAARADAALRQANVL